MKFIPRHKQVIGRVVIRRLLTAIVRPDETKHSTKFLLIDAVGPDVTDLQVGDVVIAKVLSNIVIDGGVSFRPMCEEPDVAITVVDINLADLVVQNDSGSEFVPLDSPKAAKSLGVSVSKPGGDPRPQPAAGVA